MVFRRAFVRTVAAALPLLGLSCSRAEGCLGGDDGACLPESACAGLTLECESDSVQFARAGSGVSDNPKMGRASGDLLLWNGRVRAVFDALDAPHALAPSGGTLIDLESSDGGAPDALNQLYQAAGILPDDAARYHSSEVIEHPSAVSLVYRGTLDGRPELDIVTRYELRACEAGLRVRTEVHHGGRDPLTVFAADGVFWGDHGILPFTPGRGLGFRHPEVELETLGDAFVDTQFLTAAAPGTTSAAYAIVPCDAERASGFHSATISGIGAPRRILMPGDSIAYERFIGVAEGNGHGKAISLARELRAALFGESATVLSGRVVDDLGRGVSGLGERAALLIYQPAPGSDPDSTTERHVVAEVAPEVDGRFSVLVPAGKEYRIEVMLHGRSLERRFSPVASGTELDVGELVVPAAAQLQATVHANDGSALASELVVVPVDPEAAAAYAGSVFGQFELERCSPYLGPPHGSSPACNRVLVDPSGQASFDIPAGEYYVYATRGPFYSLARERVTLERGGSQQLDFELRALPLLAADALSADLHVHGSASFDSALPDRDRALSFIASGVQVIAATDHDVVSNYHEALSSLGLSEQVRVMPGVETTGQILFYHPPGEDIPKVVGHFNFWPLRFDPLKPRRGAPHDERLQPADLIERVSALYDGVGVAQLNHPYAESKLGRDEGYLEAVGYDPRRDVPGSRDGTAEGELMHRSPSGVRNIDYDVQEVMNGSSVRAFLAYRAGWFSFLNQGILRAGTANSDSHTLAVELLGYPRNVVSGQSGLARFSSDSFNRALRGGHSFGTNGPVLSLCLDAADGVCRTSSLTSFVPAPGARLRVQVLAAPWIPVEEVRIYVNGALAKTLPVTLRAEDPFAVEPLVRFDEQVLLADLPAAGDLWIVVEAGMPLPLASDLDDDGVVETTDNNGDGHVDERDGEEQFQEPARTLEGDARFHVQAVAPGILPTAFSNPLLVDFEGDGWQAPGLP